MRRHPGLAALAVTLVTSSLVACGPEKTGCELTGCSAGSQCNPATGQCELVMTTGGGTATGGGSTGGGTATGGGGTGGGSAGGGSGGGSMGGGSGGGGPVVDPLDDGGVFVPGDICGHALAVDFDGGTSATLSVDLGPAGNHYLARCGASSLASSGNDLVFSLSLAAPQKLTVTATNTSTDSQDAVLALFEEPCPAQRALVCRDAAGSFAPEVLTAPRLPAGTWYVLLDNYGNTVNSTYDVAFQLDAPEAGPANDTCATPATLVPNVSQTVDVTSALTNATYPCAVDLGGGDVVFTFTLTQAQKVTLTLLGTSGEDGVLQLREPACASGPARACADTSSSGAETLLFNSLPAGTYFVDVAAYRASGGSFGITLELDAPVTPPANDTCAAPEVVTLVNGAAGATASLDTANPDVLSDLCRPEAHGADVVYAVDVPAGQTLTVVATPQGPDVDPVVFVRTGTCASAQSLECRDSAGGGSAETLTVPNLGATPVTMFVVVKAYDSDLGAVDVTFTVN